MKKFITFILVGFLLSCEKEENLLYPCIDEDCFGYFYIDPEVTPGVYQDENEYWHVPSTQWRALCSLALLCSTRGITAGKGKGPK